MTRLDKAANDAIRLARKMAAEKVRKEKVKPKMWNGKKIIPLSEWRKKQNFNTHEWRDYYPDKYIPDLLLYPGDNEQIRKYQDEWWKGFSQYMESIKEPAYGKLKCEKCILNPVASPLTTTIRDAIVKTHQSIDGKPLEFPCMIVNMFKCPYEDKRDLDKLQILGDIWRIFDDALKYNAKLTEHKLNTYTVDFEKKKIVHILRLDDSPKSPDVEYFFSKLKFPKFEIMGHKDLYDVITTRDKLKSVLEEYLDALSSGAENDRHNLTLVEYLRKEPDYFLDVFDKIKDVITLEELRNTNGKTLREIEDSNEKYEKFLAERRKIMSPEYRMPRPEELSGACFSCGEFANILCQNCNIWTCHQHWMDHGIQTHNYARPETSSSSTLQQ